jgi:hypothetical protein
MSASQGEHRPSYRYDDSLLEQQGTHLVHDRGALRDEALAYPVQGLQLELLLSLQGHAPHGRASGGLRDRFGIVEVVLC